MKMIQNDNIQIQNPSNKQYNPLYYHENNNIRIYLKFFYSIFLLATIVFIIIYIKNKNQQIKIDLSKNSTDKEKNEIIFLQKLKSILDKDEYLENEMMNKHTTFQIGGPARFFIKPKSINKIVKILKLCKELSIEYFILGNGSNLLVSDLGYNGLVINIHEENFSELKVEQIDEIHFQVSVGGGMLMRNLAKRLCLLSLSGLEDIIDIPGTIGGGIIMNASANLFNKLISNSLKKVKIITPEGEIKELSKDECQLGARGSMLKNNKYMVIEATFTLVKDDKIIIQKTMADHTSIRYSRQPMYFPSAGSFFIWMKPKYGSLFDLYKECNLVSYRVGDAMIYTHNIAFIVNLGKAKASDVYEIVTHVEKIFKTKYNINIIREVILLGSF